VLGGGVAGLTAAHELALQGFSVTVFERRGAHSRTGKNGDRRDDARAVLGGKAWSYDAIAQPGRSPQDKAVTLPAEHGFRFFPGFYYHLKHTVRKIPVGDETVYKMLV